MPFTNIKGTKLSYEIQGQGDPVVLLHHGFGSTAIWKDIGPGLARAGYQAIMYDRRGFGRSGAGVGFREYYVSETFRDDCVLELDRLLEFLGIEAAHLLGQCEGGVIALDFALARPGKVRTVTTSSTLCFSEVPMTELNKKMFPVPFSGLDPETREKLNLWHGEQRALFLFELGRQFGGAYGQGVFDLRKMLSRVFCPVFILYPDRSSLFAVEQGVALYRHVQNSELAVLPKCGHNTYEQLPEEYLRQVIAFLQRQQ